MSEDILARINQLERQILVHSYIYYEKDDNIWDDHFYDEHCKELYKLINENPTEARLAEWAISFDNYDPSTGYGLPLDHPWVVNKGEYLYRLRMEGKVPSEKPKVTAKEQQTLFNINTQAKPKKKVEAKGKQNKLF